VVADIHQLAAYVQSVADGAPDKAAQIIGSAGLGTHVHGMHAGHDLVAHMGPGGLVMLRAHAGGKHAAYEWQHSTDSGKTWTTLPATTTASTHVAGLTAGSTMLFRARANKGDTPGDWTSPVTFVVH
jgi:hypothetical protein